MLRRGSVVVASDPYGHIPRRPYLILSDETHPFAGEQYIAVGITTNEYPPSISLEDRFVDGGLSARSFVSPWAVVSLRETDIERAVAIVNQTVTNAAAEQVARFVGYAVPES
jgi:mRNA-degrading endonuclease toxin of MazEF toxin-antitoxin module